jgi:GTP-binding protein EngB required for normal cell division
LRETKYALLYNSNKIDKLKQSEIAASKRQAISAFPELILNENLFTFSAVKGIGKKEIIKLLSAMFLS